MNKLHERFKKKYAWYRTWHKHPQTDLGHWAIFLLIALFLTAQMAHHLFPEKDLPLTASVATSQSSPEDTELLELTRDLLNTSFEHKTAAEDKKPDVETKLGALASKRRTALEAALEHNPQAVLNNAIDEQLTRDLPPGIAKMLERKISLTGELEIVHIHYGSTIEDSTSKDIYTLIEKGTGRRYGLHFAGERPHVLTGSTLKFDGIALDSEVALTTADPSYSETAALVATPTTLKKVAVIMLNFQDRASTPWSADTVRSYFFTSPTSASAYYTEASLGKWAFTGKTRADGDVFGWFTVPYSYATCNYTGWSSSANQQAQAQGIDLTGYDNLVYVFPSANCGWIGLAYLGAGISYLNNTISGLAPTHEIGHNYGLQHANTYTCTENGARVPISSSCTSSEYADPFDTMGNISRSHFNGFYKGTPRLNFYDTGSSVTISYPVPTLTTQSYTITPLEQPTSGVKVVRIPRDPSSVANRTFYYLEFRQPSAMDTYAATAPVVNGVSIRLGHDYNQSAYSQLIDTTPATASHYDSALAVGRTFTDTPKGISITTTSITPTGATIDVTLTPAPCTRSNPSLFFNGSSSGYPGKTLTYSFTLRNNDSYSCADSTFSVAPTLPAGFVQTPTSFTETLAAGAQVMRSFNITAPTTATPGTYTMTQRATNLMSTAHTATANATYTVLAPELTPPTVTITKPAAGATIGKGKVQVAVSASDTSGISKINIMLDGAKIGECLNRGSCSASVSANSLSAGTHTITAVATDASSQLNQATTSITVRK